MLICYLLSVYKAVVELNKAVQTKQYTFNSKQQTFTLKNIIDSSGIPLLICGQCMV